MRLQHKGFDPFIDKIDKGGLYGFSFRDRGLNLEAAADDTDEDMQRRIKTEQHTFYIFHTQAMDTPESTPRNLPLAVEVEVHDTEPVSTPEVRCPIFEASLHLPTGQLHVQEYTTGRAVEDCRVELGWYRVRWFHCGCSEAKVTESGLEQISHYLAILWPAPPVESRFLQRGLGCQEPG